MTIDELAVRERAVNRALAGHGFRGLGSRTAFGNAVYVVLTDKQTPPHLVDLVEGRSFTAIGDVEDLLRELGTPEDSDAKAQLADSGPRKPRVSDVVHYVSHGTPHRQDGSQAYTSECRAAIVTAVGDLIGTHPSLAISSDEHAISLCVLNPEGMFFNRGVVFNDGQGNPGDPDCPHAAYHGQPHRYCMGCAYSEPAFAGGTWHWSGHE